MIHAQQHAPPIRSLVLAGGASTRMGVDKALLRLHGQTQVSRAVRLLELVAPPVYVSVRPRQTFHPAFRGLHLLEDREEGVGPLEGLLSAFREEPGCAWLAVAVDMPFLTRETLRRLIECRDPSALATAYRNPDTDRPEPVCTIYEPAILPALLEAKTQKRYSLMLLRDVPLRLVEPTRAGELRNVNDPDELRKAGGISFPPVP
jgi:molybdopterin-guanine dinucleotide biosynthesis protein A